MHGIKEKLWEPLAILDATAFMRQRITPWEREALCYSRKINIRKKQRSCEKKEPTEVSFSVVR